MAALFQTTPQNITMHIRAVFSEGELPEVGTCKEVLQVRQEGERQVQRSITHYNLDVIISVGYRVRSHVGTQFRIWATQRLRDYVIKGFALDDQKLKEQATVGDYFDELLERIRDNRSSEDWDTASTSDPGPQMAGCQSCRNGSFLRFQSVFAPLMPRLKNLGATSLGSRRKIAASSRLMYTIKHGSPDEIHWRAAQRERLLTSLTRPLETADGTGTHNEHGG